jgi:hypothetical protein
VLARVPAAQRGGLDHLIRTATASGLNDALLIAGLLGLAAAVIALATMRRPASAAPGPAAAPTPQAGEQPVPATAPADATSG